LDIGGNAGVDAAAAAADCSMFYRSAADDDIVALFEPNRVSTLKTYSTEQMSVFASRRLQASPSGS